MTERSQLNPEERTAILFGQDVRTLSRVLVNMDIAVLATDIRIRVDQTHPYLISENNGMYRRGKDGINIDSLPTGTLWAFFWPLRNMRLSLITAREGWQKGACIDLKKASRYDPSTRLYTPLKLKGDIANYLGLENNEAVALKFIDESNVLYLDRSTRAVPEQEETKPVLIESDAADRYMRELLGE